MVAKEVQPKSNLEALRKIRQLLVITCPDAEETLLLVANNIYGAMGSNSQLITEQLFTTHNSEPIIYGAPPYIHSFL